MTITQASAAPLTVEGRTFPLLRRKEVGELLARWAAADRPAVIARLDALGIVDPPPCVSTDPADLRRHQQDRDDARRMRIEALERYEIEADQLAVGYRSCYQFSRACDTILASLRIADPATPDSVIDDMRPLWSRFAEICEVLWDSPLRRTTAANAASGDSASPSGSPATGS